MDCMGHVRLAWLGLMHRGFLVDVSLESALQNLYIIDGSFWKAKSKDWVAEIPREDCKDVWMYDDVRIYDLCM